MITRGERCAHAATRQQLAMRRDVAAKNRSAHRDRLRDGQPKRLQSRARYNETRVRDVREVDISRQRAVDGDRLSKPEVLRRSHEVCAPARRFDAADLEEVGRRAPRESRPRSQGGLLTLVAAGPSGDVHGIVFATPANGVRIHPIRDLDHGQLADLALGLVRDDVGHRDAETTVRRREAPPQRAPGFEKLAAERQQSVRSAEVKKVLKIQHGAWIPRPGAIRAKDHIGTATIGGLRQVARHMHEPAASLQRDRLDGLRQSDVATWNCCQNALHTRVLHPVRRQAVQDVRSGSRPDRTSVEENSHRDSARTVRLKAK